jgi:hypothetical protein
MSTGVSKSQEFTASGTFNVPATVSSVYVTGNGAGGGGGGSALNDSGAASGGGSGEFCERIPMKVTPSDAMSVTIGAGGAGGVASQNGATGGSTTFGFITLLGGSGGATNDVSSGGRGGGPRGGTLSAGIVTLPSIEEMGFWSGFIGGNPGGLGGTLAANNSRGTGSINGYDNTVNNLGASRGGGGGASPFANGGNGGPGTPGNGFTGSNGSGGGGGGAGQGIRTTNGGQGGDGYLLIDWVE